MLPEQGQDFAAWRVRVAAMGQGKNVKSLVWTCSCSWWDVGWGNTFFGNRILESWSTFFGEPLQHCFLPPPFAPTFVLLLLFAPTFCLHICFAPAFCPYLLPLHLFCPYLLPPPFAPTFVLPLPFAPPFASTFVLPLPFAPTFCPHIWEFWIHIWEFWIHIWEFWIHIWEFWIHIWGILDPHLGILDPHLGILDPHLGILDPHLGILDPHFFLGKMHFLDLKVQKHRKNTVRSTFGNSGSTFFPRKNAFFESKGSKTLKKNNVIHIWEFWIHIFS